MGIIGQAKAMPGSGLGAPLRKAGAPTAATADVQTFTCTGTPTGGTFQYTVSNPIIDATATATLTIAYNETSTTLQTKLNAIYGAGNMTAGGGAWPGTALTLTGAGLLGDGPIPIAVAGTNALTGGTTPTSTVAHTTPGVNATFSNIAAIGALLIDTTNGILYQNQGTVAVPAWTKVHSES